MRAQRLPPAALVSLLLCAACSQALGASAAPEGPAPPSPTRAVVVPVPQARAEAIALAQAAALVPAGCELKVDHSCLVWRVPVTGEMAGCIQVDATTGFRRQADLGPPTRAAAALPPPAPTGAVVVPVPQARAEAIALALAQDPRFPRFLPAGVELEVEHSHSRLVWRVEVEARNVEELPAQGRVATEYVGCIGVDAATGARVGPEPAMHRLLTPEEERAQRAGMRRGMRGRRPPASPGQRPRRGPWAALPQGARALPPAAARDSSQLALVLGGLLVAASLLGSLFVRRRARPR